MISNRVFIPKSYPFVQNVSLSDLTPRFVENDLTQLEAMSSGVMADTLESPLRGISLRYFGANVLAPQDRN